MQGRDSCRLDPATSIQEQKYTVYRRYFTAFEKAVLFLLIVTNDISISEKIDDLFDFLFVRRSFFRRHSKNPIIKLLGLTPIMLTGN